MAFPDVIVECAYNNNLDEALYAQTGYTEITDYVNAVSGTLRGRSYELDKAETGSITVELDNADGRFTPGSARSPYYPNVTASRRLRIRGKNMLPLNVATTGAAEQGPLGFFLSPDNSTITGAPVAVAGDLPTLSGDLAAEDYHIEATVAAGQAAGTYRVLACYVPIELGVRLVHSAYVWLVSGSEPSGTTVSLDLRYFDAADTDLSTAAGYTQAVSWSSPSPATPTRRVLSSLPLQTSKYALLTVKVVTTAAIPAGVGLTYGIAGLQTEVPANLAPNVSAAYNTYNFTPVNGTVGQFSTGGTCVQTAWATGSGSELRTTISRLVPGRTYTATASVLKSGSGPDVLMTADDGREGVGVTLSTEGSYQTLTLTFVASSAEQDIKWIPASSTTAGQRLQVRLLSVVAGTTGALAVDDFDHTATVWQAPKPIFEGWVERWPVRVTASASDITITVNDRLKKLGEYVLASTLREAYYHDAPSLIVPFSDSPKDAQGSVSIEGAWAQLANQNKLAPKYSKGSLVGTSWTLGLQGPTDDTAVLFTPSTTGTVGYCFNIPNSAVYVVPVTPTTPGGTKPAPAVYTKNYVATWSRSYNGSGTLRTDNGHVYQGDSGEDSRGDQKSYIGFNWPAIYADLAGASVVGVALTMLNLHWWFNAGGTAWIGTHNLQSPAGSWVGGNIRRWSVSWARYAWRTVNLGVGVGAEMKAQLTRGITIGHGANGHQTYGYFSGATEANRPYLTISYRK